MSFDLLIRHVDLLEVSGPARASLLPDRDIVLEGELIAAIERGGTISPGRAKEIVEGSGMVATPGLINTHSHVPMVLFRGAAEDMDLGSWLNERIWVLEAGLDEEDVYWGSLLGIAEMIEAGVTAFADQYFHMHRVAEAVEQAGVRSNLAWGFFDAGADSVETMDRTLAFASQWNGAASGRIRTSVGPHAPYTCGFDLLAVAARRARELQLPVHIHVAESREQVETSLRDHGRTPVGVLEQAGILDVPTLLAHAAHVTPEDIDVMARREARVAHCPKTFLKMALGIAPIAAMREAGIPVGLGTDGAASNNTLDVFEAMRLATLAQKQSLADARRFTVNEALGMTFHDGARAYGQPELGRLLPGGPADLCLISRRGTHLQPGLDVLADLVYSVRASDVDTVICAGRPLLRGRELLTLDKARIVEEVRSRSERLLQRLSDRPIATYRP